MQIVSLKMFDYGRMQADVERKNRKVMGIFNTSVYHKNKSNAIQTSYMA